MMKHAWDGYVKYAWGYHELRPISRHGHSSSLFGDFSNTGVTIVDSLDTLYIMGLMDEFQRARDWIEHNLDFKKLTWGEVSVFEINIRFVGGLLSCFALTGDRMFREKALLIAERLLPAFDTPTGIPLGIVNMENGVSRNPSWASEGSSILSELGTLSLEFNYLSDVTGKDVFRQKIQKLTGTIKRLDRHADGGLYPNFINPWTGDWGDRHVSMGAFGDSFYEYLLKSWLLSGRQDDEARLMYIDAVEAALAKLIQVSREGFTYFADSNSGRLEHKMQHLACFSGGMLGLGGFYLGEPFKRRHMAMGKAITRTCRESYNRSTSQLGPETFRFNEQLEAEGLEPEAAYLLRPEVVESYFIMWRLTHDPIYREWGWDVVLALERHCRVEGAGYSGLKNVNEEKPVKDDVQQSFFLAETLKYLYLLFSDDDVLPLDQWVFNTEAHPLPVSLPIKDISTPNPKFVFRDQK
ncbi:mannosyl-oligosaccharide alpha-1,2-mannosidase IA-like isoform X2 [Daphnia pulex]|nr:mannosyl-oligosaccharide alpha-1,2-mannosidase IA-like isoform X2 [Daphnia pulex]XP_046462412.1 mannosyl-oligosaccharide alpha-1,2-mannosidase IA-like isoform X2 [Daphnia pulex]